MKLLISAFTIAAGVIVASSAAQAGVYTDDLSKCLVSKASDDDKTTLVRWIFAAASASPVVGPMASVSAAERSALHRSSANLFERLITIDCRAEVVAALKYEGPIAFEASFGVLGEIAMRGLMSHPLVASEMQAFGELFDKAKMQELGQEAGLPPPATAPAK